MSTSHTDSVTRTGTINPNESSALVTDPTKKKKKSISMHEDVQVWDDCCTCEAEPYWIEALERKDSISGDDESESG